MPKRTIRLRLSEEEQTLLEQACIKSGLGLTETIILMAFLYLDLDIPENTPENT